MNPDNLNHVKSFSSEYKYNLQKRGNHSKQTQVNKMIILLQNCFTIQRYNIVILYNYEIIILK